MLEIVIDCSRLGPTSASSVLLVENEDADMSNELCKQIGRKGEQRGFCREGRISFPL